jgi:hypothetical protein
MTSLLAGCDDGEPEPEPPAQVAGSYALTLQQGDTTCFPPEFDIFEILDFADDTGGLHLITVEITQSGPDLEGLLGPSGCVLTGAVVASGTFSLTGPCDDSIMARHLSMTGTISPYGNNLSLEAVLVIEVDLLVDGAGDGEVDCVVDPVNVSGTGAPES